MKQIMDQISTLRTDVKERPSFLTANGIFFFGGWVGVCEKKMHLYSCNDGITRFLKNGERWTDIFNEPQ